MKMFRRDEGFTLVELMVVVLIIGILVAIAVPVFLNASANAELKSCQATQRTIDGAIQTYNSGGTATFTGQLINSSSVLVPNYIKSAPKCPGSTTTVYYDTNQTGVRADRASVAASDTAASFTHAHY